MFGSFTAIDWERPWLAHVRALGEPICQKPDWRAEINATARAQNLRNHRGLPVHFIPQGALPDQVGYEAHISATGEVPTRDNLHDFFNALIWLTFPKTKSRLNALQAEQIATSNLQTASTGRRGVLRDAATIFDENAALWITNDSALTEALRNHDWQRLFLHQPDFGAKCQVMLFGHALLEKLVQPYKAITAHAWHRISPAPSHLTLPEQKTTAIDDLLSEQLATTLSTADFLPVPVLGIPGWWHEQDSAFYADTAVFRPARGRSPNPQK